MKRPRTRRRTSRRAEGSRRWQSLLLVAVIGLLVLGVGGTVGTVGVVGYYSQGLPSIEGLSAANLAQSTRIYDRNGTVLRELSHENRTVVPLGGISMYLQNATISVEDRTFYSNAGVDYRRVLIAAAYDATHRSAALGGSTITQQVVKNSVLADTQGAKTFDRKMRELLLAEEMERRYTKSQILELYLNTIYYGNGAYGAEAAAQTYFGVHAADLDLPEASYLAGLPQSPNNYDAFGTPDQVAAARERWAGVLAAMVANHAITPAEERTAEATDIFAKMTANRALHRGRIDPVTAHFIDYTLQYLRNHGYADKQLYESGLQIYTTLDLPTQRLADKSVKDAVAVYAKSKGVNTGALLAMDPKTGEILAMVGSADFNNDGIRGQVNLTDIGRQPGSSFKPYTYAVALQSGRYTSATRVNDAQDTIGGTKFTDWDGKLEGYIPLRQALAESRNLPAMWTFKDVGPQKVIDFAHRLGISTPLDPNSVTTTIGSGDLKMTDHLAAYSAFDNGGIRVYQHPILRLLDASGKTLPAFPENTVGGAVMTPQLSFLMTDLMHGVPAAQLGMGARPVAAKSGTTEAWTSAWYVGYTPDLAVSALMAHINSGDTCTSGFANYASSDVKTSGWICPVNVLWGEHVGESLWKPFLNGYYANGRAWPATWKRPDGIVTANVCRLDGNLADSTTAPDQRYDEVFLKGVGEPGPKCGANPPPGTPTPTPSPAPSPSPPAAPTPPPPTPIVSPVPSPRPSASPSPSPSPSPLPSPTPSPTPK